MYLFIEWLRKTRVFISFRFEVDSRTGLEVFKVSLPRVNLRQSGIHESCIPPVFRPTKSILYKDNYGNTKRFGDIRHLFYLKT